MDDLVETFFSVLPLSGWMTLTSQRAKWVAGINSSYRNCTRKTSVRDAKHIWWWCGGRGLQQGDRSKGERSKGETEVNKIKVYILNYSKGDVIGWYKVFLSKLQQIWWRDHQEVINAVIGHGLFFVF